MQETLLRVFVVGLGLLLCPREDPGVEEWDGIITVDMQKHDESLLREEEKLDEEIPVSEKKVQTDNKGPQDDRENIPEEHNQSDQLVTEKDKIPDSEEDSADCNIAKPNPYLPQNNSEPETALKTPCIAHKPKEKDVQTDGPLRGMKHKKPEKEMFSTKEQEAPLSHIHTKTSEMNTSEQADTEWERCYLWYIWNMFSIISMIRFFMKYLRKNSQKEVTRAFQVAEVPLPDVGTLQNFYAKVSLEKKWREDEFLEGFANDLLEAMRTICGKNGGMLIENFQMVNACDINVPFVPPEPYSFQCLLWNNQSSDRLSDMQVCGQIKLVENKIQDGCHCQSSDADMVCLLHCENVKVKTVTDVYDGLHCLKSTPFLSKSQVTRWFQTAIKQAWAQISHKYEFELNMCYIDAPGALSIRFRSGKMISFSINPVVKFNTDAHFFIAPWSSNNFDTFWTLSLTTYEDKLLEHLSKSLPENSCHIQTLEIACFLHKRQTVLSGTSALKDFHFKTALMHLLLSKEPSQWKTNNVASRLRDLLAFVERSLEKKLLNHVLIGNPLTEVIELPAEFTEAEPVNLFHPLVVHNCIYRNAVTHFQEILRNGHMLIHDYADKCPASAN